MNLATTSDPTAERLVSIPHAYLSRLVSLADAHVQDIVSGLEDGTYERAENPNVDSDLTLIRDAQAICDQGPQQAAQGHWAAPVQPKVVAVMKNGEIAQLLSDAAGLSIAVVEIDPQANEDVVLIPRENGRYSRGWAGICSIEQSVQRTEELYAVAETGAVVDFSEVATDGRFSGQILSIAGGIATQKIDRQGNTVQHDLSSVDQAVKVGDVLGIDYHHGMGRVSGQVQSQEVGR